MSARGEMLEFYSTWPNARSIQPYTEMDFKMC